MQLHQAGKALEMVMGTTRLFSTASPEEQWQAVAGPWLRELAGLAWKNSKPTVVLTPSRAESFYLRSRLVSEAIPYLGLRFWTPSDARKFLVGEMAPKTRPASQAELRLVARTCAEKLVSRSASDGATLSSVIREPGAFLSAYDLLQGAGWDPAREGSVYGRGLASEMQREMGRLGISTQAGLHRDLERAADEQKPALIANLLVVGFNAAHWPLWDLLKAIVVSADNATVALSSPRYFAQDVDQLWIGSWEEWTKIGAAAPPSSIPEHERPFATLAASYETGVPADIADAELSFLVTTDLALQARAMVLQILEYLKRDDCTRLGVVFPEANALALNVAAELRRLAIPLDDGTGTWQPGLFEKSCWRRWIELQEEPGVQRLIAWVRACEAEGVSYGLDLPARKIADVLDSALGESLVDDLDFLASHLEAGSNFYDEARIAHFLCNRIALPKEAAFADFLSLTRKAMNLPGWELHLAQLQIEPPAWLSERDETISRRSFLEWLKESTDSRVRSAGAEGNHFYGKVHLLIYAQIGSQNWSHLILTGLNESIWPRVFETGAFESRHELIALNQQARRLNVRGTTEGSQGEGHVTVAGGKGHCLLPMERHDLSLRDLCAALEGTSKALCLTAITTESGRGLLPSDFFNHAYQCKSSHVLDDNRFRAMADATGTWCEKHASLLEPKSGTIKSDIVSTQIAYQARRDATQPFGPYEFSYARPPAGPVQLSCKEWENAWNHPSSVWLNDVVGATSWPEGYLSWSRAVGTWAHRWLAAALKECQARNSTMELPVLVWAAADREAQTVRNRAHSVQFDLRPWWELVWNQAKTMALGLAETLGPHLLERQYVCEHRLPQDLMIALPGSDKADFLLKGRIDLLLIKSGEANVDLSQNVFAGCECWVIDFKTGSAQTLNGKRIGEGKGLQPVLYALAIRALGATSIDISIHTPDAVLKPQIELEEILQMWPFFRSLEKLHRDGVFGMRADSDNEYGYSPSYPMATRSVAPAILEAKWNLVHGPTPLEASV